MADDVIGTRGEEDRYPPDKIRENKLKTLKEIEKRLEAELLDPELPLHRKTEIEASLYYLMEDVRFLKNER